MIRFLRVVLVLLVAVALVGVGSIAWMLRESSKPPSEPEGAKRPPAWSSTLDGTGPIRAAMVAGDAVLVQGDRQLVVLDKVDGRVRWHKPLDPGRRWTVLAGAGGVAAFVRGSVKLYDLTTGEERYAQTFTGDAAVTTSTLVVNDCPDKATQCSLTARDMTTGGQRWQRSYPRPAGWDPSPATLEVLGTPMELGGNQRAESMATRAADVVLVREGRAPDGTWKVTIRDITTGDPVSSSGGGWTMPDLTTWIVTARTMLAWDLDADGCELTVSGYDVRRGQVGWTATAGQWRLPHGLYAASNSCGRSAWAPLVAGATMAVTTAEQRVQLLGLDDGKVRWTGEPGGHAFALTDRCVVARVGNGGGDLVGLDPADGRRRWESPVPRDGLGKPYSLDRVTAAGDRLLYQYYFVPSGRGGKARNVLRAVDVGTGHLDWIADNSGYLLGAGPGWVVTGADGIENDEGSKEIRLYAG